MCVLSLPGGGLFRLIILHTGDFRSRYGQVDASGAECTRGQVERGECFGGIARLVSKVKEIRAEGGNVILLDSGNQFEATPWFAAYRESAAVHFMNITGYDAMAIGYREFDINPSGVARFIQHLPFPVISSNIDAGDEPELQSVLSGSAVINLDGENVGVVGYTYGDGAMNTNIGELQFTDELESVSREVQKLKLRGVNKIVVLGSSSLNFNRFIATQVDGVDVVIGSGTRTFLYNGEPPSIETATGPYPVPVVTARDNSAVVAQIIGRGKYLGRLDVSFDRNGNIKDVSGNPILLGKTVTEDPATKADVEEWEFGFRGLPGSLGKSGVLLEGTREACRTMECPLGNVIADAMVMASMTPATNKKWTDATIAIVNAGAIRGTIPIGNIYTDDMSRVLPYRSTADMLSLQGQYIKEALEHAVADYNPNELQGGFLQVSGLRVVYDLSKSSGDRVQRLYALCSECLVPRYVPLDVDEIYKVVVPNFIANGGDGYRMISDNKMDHTTGLALKDALRVYIKEHSPVVTPLEGRIRFISSTEDYSNTKASPHSDEPPSDSSPGSRWRELLRPAVVNLRRSCMDDADVYPPHMSTNN